MLILAQATFAKVGTVSMPAFSGHAAAARHHPLQPAAHSPSFHFHCLGAGCVPDMAHKHWPVAAISPNQAVPQRGLARIYAAPHVPRNHRPEEPA